MLKPASAEALVIGASAGAVEALCHILPVLPADLDAPVVVVVHVPPHRSSLLCDIFAPRCSLPVREPQDKEPLRPGTIYFAPPDYHLLIEQDRCFALSLDAPVNFSRPSIDVLFESAADAYGERLLALILTGANQDGAEGAARIRQAGGLVAVQDPSTAESPQMPQAAIARAHPQLIGTLAELAALAQRALRRGSS